MARTGSEAARRIGERIAKLRRQRDLTQREVAALSGIDESNLGKYERGLALPNVASVVRIAAVFKIDPGLLLEGLVPDDLPDRPLVLTAEEFVAERRRRGAR